MSSKFWSELTHRLTPYVPGEQRLGERIVKLNTNENPYPPSPKVMEAIAQTTGTALRCYPDPESTGLRNALAQFHQVDSNQVFVGNGSDEILALAFMAFFTNKLADEAQKQSMATKTATETSDGAKLQYPELSYSFYPVYCELLDIPTEVYRMRDDFSIDMDKFENNGGGIIFPNPNAPTSLLQPLDAIESLVERVPDTLVLIDEAYIDFGGQSAVSLVGRYPNLVVSQTFSKSRSLAGMRLGAAFANKDLIDGLERVKNSFNSYPCDAIAQQAGIASIADNVYYQETLQRIMNTRDASTVALKQRGFKVLDSAANFIFVSPSQYEASGLFKYLSDQGVLVRYWSSENLCDWIRISIGSDAEMQELIDGIDAYAAEISSC